MLDCFILHIEGVQSVETSAIVRDAENWKGLSPLGTALGFAHLPLFDLVTFSNLTNVARKTGASSEMLSENLKIEGIVSSKGKQLKNKLTKNKAPGHHPSEYKKGLKSSSFMMIAPPNWNQLRISLDPSAVEDRIYVREFMLRFGRVMNPIISKNHMEELELIAGGSRGRDKFEEMPLWVSESCVKSMILGLLGLLITKYHNAEVLKFLLSFLYY